MAGKQTRALTKDEFFKLVELIQTGGYEYEDKRDGKVIIRTARPNNTIATMIVIQANLGVRVCDLVSLKPKNILTDGDDYMLDIIEKKTGKLRNYLVSQEIVNLLKDYIEENNIGDNEYVFNMSKENMQRFMLAASKHLNYKNISTHSNRKYFATELYELSNHDIVFVSKMLIHADTKTTLRYIGLSKNEQKKMLNKFTAIPLKKGV